MLDENKGVEYRERTSIAPHEGYYTPFLYAFKILSHLFNDYFIGSDC